MRVKVLGAAAGGGLPQWNCGCPNCRDAREGRLPRMTQSSVAVSVDGRDWVVLNASPDIHAQIEATPELWPRALRDSPIRAVICTNGDIDHIAGLLTLREGQAFDLWATGAGLAVIASDRVFGVMNPDKVPRRRITLDQAFEPLPGLQVTAFAVPGKVALFLEGATPDPARLGEETVGLRLQAGGRVAYYIPGCAALPDWLLARIADGDLLLFDGTVWTDDEMATAGTGTKTGARMGHLAISGPEGSLARLASTAARKVLIHINNTNPILRPDGPERAELEALGWTVAHDGMEIDA
ncbi:pyrroloquinoline quinone biosynthesis protein PqqB [Frigidibacter sp. MR17.14]|uniref:pyrroloquinoline quinone biosynthesis protein PqqB n=1 Tax=Frigidibacter sp. MR17.14 TaxID=3126509 RepID=UPI003012FB1B